DYAVQHMCKDDSTEATILPYTTLCRSLSPFHVIVSRLQESQNNVFDIFSYIPRLGQSRRVGDRERHPEHLCERLGEQRLARSGRSEEHTSELQSRENLVCRLLLEQINH